MPNRIYYSDEAENYAKRKMVFSTVIFTTVGVALGAIIALLFAPKEGSDIRDNLGSEIKSGMHNGHDATGDAVKRLEKQYGHLRDQIDDLVNKVRN